MVSHICYIYLVCLMYVYLSSSVYADTNILLQLTTYNNKKDQSQLINRQLGVRREVMS